MNVDSGTIKVAVAVTIVGVAVYALYKAGQKVSSAIESASAAVPQLASDAADATKYAFGEVVNFGGAAANSYGNVIREVSPSYYNWAAKQDFLYPIFDYFTGNKLAQGSN